MFASPCIRTWPLFFLPVLRCKTAVKLISQTPAEMYMTNNSENLSVTKAGKGCEPGPLPSAKKKNFLGVMSGTARLDNGN